MGFDPFKMATKYSCTRIYVPPSLRKHVKTVMTDGGTRLAPNKNIMDKRHIEFNEYLFDEYLEEDGIIINEVLEFLNEAKKLGADKFIVEYGSGKHHEKRSFIAVRDSTRKERIQHEIVKKLKEINNLKNELIHE